MGAGADPGYATGPAFPARLPQQPEQMDRSVVIALWIGGSVVVLLIVAMVLTSLLGNSDADPADQSVAEAKPQEPPAAAPDDPKPATTKAASKTAKKKSNRPKADTRPTSQPAESSGVSIRLSAGTALAQTLPTGTAMGFSVDYRFANGQPSTSAEYLWVIQTGDGQLLKKPVRLQSRGTLQDFVPQLRPKNGPFRTHMEDYRGTRLSESLELR